MKFRICLKFDFSGTLECKRVKLFGFGKDSLVNSNQGVGVGPGYSIAIRIVLVTGRSWTQCSVQHHHCKFSMFREDCRDGTKIRKRTRKGA